MQPSANESDIAFETMEDVLGRLDRVRPTTRGWSACCPAHADRTPSLSLAEGETCVLVKCWAGCKLDDIAAAMGLRVRLGIRQATHGQIGQQAEGLAERGSDP
jgi:hypothetical protein